MTEVETHVDQYLESLRVRGYAKGTIHNHAVYLEQFTAFLNQKNLSNVRHITQKVIYEYQIVLSQLPLSPLTVIAKLSVLCRFFRYLHKHRFLLIDLSRFIHRPKRGSLIPKNILTEDEANLFLGTPDTRSRKGVRDKAIMELFYSTGIRRSELVELDLYDVNFEDQMIKVTGKGNKERIVPFGSAAGFWLEKYLREVREPKKEKEQALFLELLCHSRIKRQTITHIIQEYSQKIGMKKHISPHSFRHTCATHMLKHGADIRYVQEMLGHASPVTTQVYTRVEIRDLEDIYHKCHPRSRRK
jgi:integrase/recombinase XerD